MALREKSPYENKIVIVFHLLREHFIEWKSNPKQRRPQFRTKRKEKARGARDGHSQWNQMGTGSGDFLLCNASRLASLKLAL